MILNIQTYTTSCKMLTLHCQSLMRTADARLKQSAQAAIAQASRQRHITADRHPSGKAMP